MLVARSGDGSKTDSTESPNQGDRAKMAQGLTLDFDPTGMSQDELKDKLMEKLKEQGIDVDGANVQIMTTDEPPK